jgi:LacI family transcriptional regulator
MPTIWDVAKKARVSKTTVSRVINNQGPVKEETRDRILEVMKALNYQPNYIARGMRTNKTHSIGIVVPDYANPFYAEMFRGIESVTRNAGYMSFMCNTDAEKTRELHFIKELLSRKIEGIIYCTYGGDKETIEYLLSLSDKIPVIYMDPVILDKQVSFVLTDGYAATRDATHYLINKGRRKIAYIKGPRKYKVTHERFAGYEKALEEAGIRVENCYMYEGDFSMQSGSEAARSFLQCDVPPQAVMAATDVMAIGALKYIKKTDKTIPDDINIIGFDNIALTELVDPSLTTIAQPIFELGKTAAELLLEQIANIPNYSHKKIFMEGRLIERESTAK